MQDEHVNALKTGAVVAEYRIERLLGHGGFGLTYLARDQNLNALVAIKEYLPQEFAVRAANSTIVPKSRADDQGYEWGLQRFKQEARALALFKHPNIVRASRLIETNNTAYLVMDYERGMALNEYIKKHGPTLEESLVLGLFLPILDGLAALHRTGLIHRDIKPGNIYLRAEGGPMLIDFGAARHAVGAHSRSLTAVVTPGFAPIEQYSSEGKQGPWTDLYAIGATMYNCILGRSPMDAARRSAAISDGEADPLVSAARIGKGKYSDELLAAIDKAMQFRTRDRPQTASELQAAMRLSPVAPRQIELPDDSASAEITDIGASSRPTGRGAAAPKTGAASRPLPTGGAPKPEPAVERTQLLPAQSAGGSQVWTFVAVFVVVLAVALAAAFGLRAWLARSSAEREARLWTTAQQADSVDGYRTYLEVCELCDARPAAAARLAELTAQAKVAAQDAAQAQTIAALKIRFAQLLVAGATDAASRDGARRALDELARASPNDPFVATGRAQLAQLERGAASPPVAAAGKKRGGVVVAPAATAAKPDAFVPVAGSSVKPVTLAPALQPEPAPAAIAPPPAAQAAAQAPLTKDAAATRGSEAPRTVRTAPSVVLPVPLVETGSTLKPNAGGASANANSAVRDSTPIANSHSAANVTRIRIDARNSAPPLVPLPSGTLRVGDPPIMGKVAAFALGLREVTRGEFKLFAERSKYHTDAEQQGGCMVLRGGAWVRDGNLNWRRVPADQGDDHPVTCVSQQDALAYVAWLSEVAERDFRLPTEREWEFAARGGTSSAWWWGDSLLAGGANCAGCGGRSAPRPLATASLLANPFGLFDMSGNVAEWTCSAFVPDQSGVDDACPRARSRKPQALPQSFVLRGGSFAMPADRARSAAREGVPAGEPRFDTGFRVASDR